MASERESPERCFGNLITHVHSTISFGRWGMNAESLQMHWFNDMAFAFGRKNLDIDLTLEWPSPVSAT